MIKNNRLVKRTELCKKNKEKVFCAFLTLGFKSLKITEQCIWECEKSGVDVLELGFPFSDPLADGPTIQKASESAIAKGVRVEDAFKLIERMRKQGLKLPVVFFTYLNPVLNYGYSRFAKDASNAGFDGLLVPDLPPDEESQLQSICKKQNLANIFLIAPTTSTSRAREICESSSGFIYYVSLRGVTGARSALSKDLHGHLQKIRKLTKKSMLVGFGVSNEAQAKAIAKLSDGVIVGSALIQEIAKSSFSVKKFGRFVSRMVRATKSI